MEFKKRKERKRKMNQDSLPIDFFSLCFLVYFFFLLFVNERQTQYVFLFSLMCDSLNKHKSKNGTTCGDNFNVFAR